MHEVMKKIIFLLILATQFLASIAQPIHKDDRQTIVFRFKNLNIIVSNHGTIDPLLNGTSPYKQFPFPSNGFNVYGYYMKILATETDQPFLDTYHPTRVVIDTSSADAQLMRIEDLEVLDTFYIQQSSAFTNRKDIKLLPKQNSPGSYPFSNDSIFHAASYYIVLKGQLSSGGSHDHSITFRNKRTKQNLLRLNVNGVERPILPALETWLQDTSRAYRDLTLDKYRAFYGILLSEEILQKLEHEDTGIEMRNEKMQSTVLAFYFRKLQASRDSDSPMEYKLEKQTGSNTDNVWHRTGNQVLLTQLEHGESYKLQVRYRVHPKYIQEYTFYIEPKWYQTTKFKIYILFGFLGIGFAFVVRRYRRWAITERRKKEQLTLELKAIRAQLNPHFVFNAMSSIQGLINKREIDAANEYLTEFSTLLRESLNNNEKELIPISTEIRLLDTYLKLEQLRFHFKYVLSVDEFINTNAIEIPILLLQPIVEKAIKHGVSGLNENGLVKVDLTAKDQHLLISVSDNGKGFTKTTPTTGFGLKLTKERILLLNQTLKGQPIELSIESIKNTGTTVHLSFKNWL